MDHAREFFRERFTSCTDRRITEIEGELNLRLPEGYRDLLRRTGGGEVDEDKRFRVPLDSYGEGHRVGLQSIPGNTSRNVDIDDMTTLRS